MGAFSLIAQEIGVRLVLWRVFWKMVHLRMSQGFPMVVLAVFLGSLKQFFGCFHVFSCVGKGSNIFYTLGSRDWRSVLRSCKPLATVLRDPCSLGGCVWRGGFSWRPLESFPHLAASGFSMGSFSKQLRR